MKKTILKLSLLGALTITTLIEANACQIGKYPLEHRAVAASQKGTIILDQDRREYTDYIKITGADKLYANGENTKAIIIDSYFDKDHEAIHDNLTESTIAEHYRHGEGSHGTHVTGIIKNIASLTKIKFIQRWDLLPALMTAAASEGDIVNTSFCWSHIMISPLLQDALQDITNSGKIIFKAFGNDANQEPHYIIKLIRLANDPRYKGRIVLVSSTSYSMSDKERLSSFSDYATIETSNALCAPGDDIYAPIEGGYKLQSGTSMASPNAAGNFLLLKSMLIHKFGSDFFSNDEILSFLKEGARTQSLNESFVFGSHYGNGVVDVNASYKLACQAVKKRHLLEELTINTPQLKETHESEKNIYNKKLKLNEALNDAFIEEFHIVTQAEINDAIIEDFYIITKTEINEEDTQSQEEHGGFLNNITQTFWNFFV